jgi:hypothetical protein
MPVEELLNTLALMKSGHSSTALALHSGKAVLCFILAHIHHDHAFYFKTWNKSELAPVIKYIAIDILLKIIKRKQHLFIESANDISTFFCLPVVAINTRSTNGCIAIRTSSFSLEATFVHVNNGIALLCKAIKLPLISRSFYQASLWML